MRRVHFRLSVNLTHMYLLKRHSLLKTVQPAKTLTRVIRLSCGPCRSWRLGFQVESSYASHAAQTAEDKERRKLSRVSQGYPSQIHDEVGGIYYSQCYPPIEICRFCRKRSDLILVHKSTRRSGQGKKWSRNVPGSKGYSNGYEVRIYKHAQVD